MRITRANKSIVIEDNISDSINSLAPRKTDLKNIIELTQEYDPNPPTETNSSQKSQTHQECPAQSRLTGFRRYLNCFKHIWRFICYSPGQLQLDVTDNDFAAVISRLKSKKKHYQPVLPPQKDRKKVLVLDLDETLIHTSFTKPEKYDYESEVMFNGRATKIYTVKRFGLQSFLFEMSKLFQIVIFTASQKLYADKVIDLIDPKKRVGHRLYREHCIVINKSYYLKNLSILGRNLKEVVIVDDNNIAGILQPQNFYRIEPFEGNEKDRQLCRLSAFLKHIHGKADILPVRDLRKRFEEMEINLQEEVIGAMKASGFEGRSLSMKKKQYKHKKSNSEIESLVKKTEEADVEAETTASDMIKKL